MEQNDTAIYKKCINCGRYCPEAIMIVGQFCCEDCADQFRRCPHCGKYFILTDDQEQMFCSTSCQNAEKTYTPGEKE
ncbi:hypothetical protein EXM22_07980 [Oceanispirochaeta crateris]|jgi:endogenous inhibitor of DNA gyrase (YacG/DUF329 family)|uniref:Uncharacterized protein n=1 Tax=Oceanispirochaeta crateris TaxID=2518645 RepID=A0A5C1QKC5_9SPIO|nr:DUF6076 domain-containing protein [Oceanispirochaeta crateris]QEN07927.1 hypothetical protein EXM22_07980 [Oceanispirochaeta crateris]